ncbi:MAG: hypothetical protein ACP5OZ_04575 [Candidatus Woesearchaeota archaeon]
MRNTKLQTIIQTRAQTAVSQVFIFIFVALVISLTLILGYKYIAKLKEANENLEFAKFKTLLENQIKSISAGESDTFKAKLPSSYDLLCFLSGNPTAPGDELLQTLIQNEVLKANVDSKPTVFLISKQNRIAYSFYFDKIVSNELQCFKNNDDYILKGVGKKIYVEKP